MAKPCPGARCGQGRCRSAPSAPNRHGLVLALGLAADEVVPKPTPLAWAPGSLATALKLTLSAMSSRCERARSNSTTAVLRLSASWAAAGLAIEARPTQGHDRLGITGTFCAIAETGTLVVLSGADTPTATTLLVDTHIAVVRADRIVAGMEEAFALIRSERGVLPRAVNMISGPSRTGDIELPEPHG